MTDDPIRVLDAIEPPDQWDLIVARASATPHADAPAVTERHRSRPLVLVAAVVVVLVALVAALAIRSGRDHTDRAGDPSLMWGQRWQLVRVDVGEVPITTELLASDGGAIVLDAQQRGEVVLHVCNRVGGDASIVDGRLVGRDWTTTDTGCPDPLEALVQIDGTAVDAGTDRLVLTKPGFRYEFRPVGTLPSEAAIVGRRWVVTGLSGSSGRATEIPLGEGPTLDLRTEGEVLVEGCGPQAKDGKVVGDRLEVEPGDWRALMLDCAMVPMTEHAPAVQEIIDAGATIEREEDRLVVRSDAGSFTAVTSVVSSVWDLFADSYSPSTSRWVVVEAREQDRRRELVGTPVLTVSNYPEGSERTLDLSGCGSIGGEITDVIEDANTIHYRPALGGVYMGCSAREGSQAAWITDVLAAKPTVDVVGDRARITSDGGSLLLVRME